MKDVSLLKVASQNQRNMKNAAIHPLIRIRVMKAIEIVAGQGLDPDHVTEVTEGIENHGVDQNIIAEDEKMANWIQQIQRMQDARLNIGIFKRNGKKRRREMNMKVHSPSHQRTNNNMLLNIDFKNLF